MEFSSMFSLSIIVIIALLFDFLNGFHDAANSIATVVSTRVMSPRFAVVWAAFFNLIAYFIFGLHVANTLGKGLVIPSIVDPHLILAALLGAIFWNILTWFYGLPSSSSHALIGGLAGAALVKGGFHVLIASGFINVALFIILSPLVGFVLAFIIMKFVTVTFYRISLGKMNKVSRKLQIVSSALYSLGHGGNDAQKTMGIIAILLFATGKLGSNFYVPYWVILSCYFAMALGTLFGGWRIVRTMGMKITKLKPIGGFCAELGGSISLFASTFLGIPVSTTHTITGSIMGVGAVNRFSAVRWGIAQRIVWAWILTIPGAAFVAAVVWWVIGLIPSSK